MRNNIKNKHIGNFQEKYSVVCKTGSFLLGTLLILVSGCVKDDLYNTPHPDKGAVVIATDWSDALAEADVPSAYCLCMDNGKTERTTEKSCCYPDLLLPGEHSLLLYNEPQGISISGTTATINLREDGTLEPMPEYLFSATQKLYVAPDDTLRVTVPMVRRLCPIVLKLSLTGENKEEIARIEATLSGMAGSVELQSGTLGSEKLTVGLDVKSIETRTPSSGIEIRCRTLGVNSQERQLLTVTVTMRDGYQSRIISDLTEALKELNKEMTPIVLDGTVPPPQDGHFEGSITDWKVTDDLEVDAQ